MRTLIKKGEKFMHVPAEDESMPVFSEEFLYPKMTKTDARFILGVAEEYEKIIDILGVDRIWEMLGRGK